MLAGGCAMKESQPTWPQMSLIVLSGLAVVFLCYLLANMRERLGAATPWVIALLCLSVIFFLAVIFLFYIRPQYGGRSLLFMAAFLVLHLAIVLLLWKMGALR